jgi:hypothetical protein
MSYKLYYNAVSILTVERDHEIALSTSTTKTRVKFIKRNLYNSLPIAIVCSSNVHTVSSTSL